MQIGWGLVTGGLSGSLNPPSLVSLGTISLYNPSTKSFSDVTFTAEQSGESVSELAVPRSSHTQTTLQDGRILITGGHTGAFGTSPGTATDSVEIITLDAVLRSGPSMGQARAMHTATLLPDGDVVVVGGDSWQVFTPGSDTWSENHPLMNTRTGHAAVLMEDYTEQRGDHRVLVIGGEGTGPDTMEILDPATGVSTLMNSTLPVGVDDLAAVPLSAGRRVLIVGGQDVNTGDTISDVYLYAVAEDLLAPTASLPERAGGISDHEIVRIDQYVVVFGGEEQVNDQDTELDYYAIFDTLQAKWFEHGSMNFAHDDAAIIELQDGSVLIIGGGVPFLDQELPSANAELFTFTKPEPGFRFD
jgi:hypothetical protein